MGVSEDVSIKVADLYVPVKFTILEMEEDTHTPIILSHRWVPYCQAKW